MSSRYLAPFKLELSALAKPRTIVRIIEVCSIHYNIIGLGVLASLRLKHLLTSLTKQILRHFAFLAVDIFSYCIGLVHRSRCQDDSSSWLYKFCGELLCWRIGYHEGVESSSCLNHRTTMTLSMTTSGLAETIQTFLNLIKKSFYRPTPLHWVDETWCLFPNYTFRLLPLRDRCHFFNSGLLGFRVWGIFKRHIE